jgi:hypothetical protein
MRKQVATAAKTYSKAKAVAVLWLLSIMLPVLITPHQKWHFEPINFGAIGVFAGVVLFLIRFVRRRIAEESWAVSDSIVYVLVPSILFFAYFSLMLSPVVR